MVCSSQEVSWACLQAYQPFQNASNIFDGIESTKGDGPTSPGNLKNLGFKKGNTSRAWQNFFVADKNPLKARTASWLGVDWCRCHTIQN